MSDEHLRPVDPDDTAHPGESEPLPGELLPLDDLLWRDGARWQRNLPSDRRLVQLARQLATYAETTTTSAGLSTLELDTPPSEPLPQQAPHHSSSRLTRWRVFGAIAATVVVVGLLATLLHGHGGSRTASTASVAIAGDCSQSSTSAQTPVEWRQFGFGAAGGRCNPHETRLSPANARNLALAWHASGPFIDSSPAVVDGRVYVASIYPDSTLYVFDALTGEKIWGTPDGQPVETSSTSPAVADGMVLLGVSNLLEAFDAASGRLVWRFAADSLITTSPTIADGVVYVASQDRHAYALNARTGHRIWETPLPGIPATGPIAVTSDLVYVSANAVYALDRASGAIRWHAGTDPLNAPVVAGNAVYVSESDFRIHAYQADSGKPLWESQHLANVAASPVGMQRGGLYTGDANGRMWMLDGATGSRKWSVQLPDSTIVFSSPAIANGVVYVTGSCDCGTSDAHFIFALRASDGRLLWQFAPGYPVYTSPVVVNGYLYVATYHGLDAFTVG